MIRSQDNDLTLTADCYITDQDEPDYPVVSEFIAWRFPEILPDHWRSAITSPTSDSRYGAGESAMAAVVKALDDACVLSGFKQGSIHFSYLV